MRNPIRFAPFAVGLALLTAGCGGASDEVGGQATAASGGGTELALVAYSTPEVVYDELIPAFAKTEAGGGVTVKTSFGASGDQSRAVEAGQKADVVSFSVEPDVTRLEKAGLVEKGAAQLVSTSQVVFIVREGNPKGIRTWDDLLKDGVEVITPNPFTSGAAKWNLLAAYGNEQSGRGLPYVTKLISDHVEVQPKSGREALQAFLDGQGDVLLSYEYEAVTAKKKGETGIETVVPDDTIRIEIPSRRRRTPHPRRGSSSTTSAPTRARGSSRGGATARPTTRPGPSRSTTSGAGARSTTASSTPRRASSRSSSRSRRWRSPPSRGGAARLGSPSRAASRSGSPPSG
jgi:sulfate/thiosulfate transport system substrate-binding protein